MKTKAEFLAEARERLDSFDEIDGRRLRDAMPLRQLEVIDAALSGALNCFCNNRRDDGMNAAADSLLMIRDLIEVLRNEKSPTA